MKRIATTVLLCCIASPIFAADSFRMCWSIYTGWMPWAYAADKGIVDKWADKYDIEIEVVQFNDYIESLNQYTSGRFDACTMTNMDALIMPGVGGVDSTALIIGDVSNGNDALVHKNLNSLVDLKGQNVNLVQYSVSHYLLARALESVGMSESDLTLVNTSDADIVSAYSTDDVTSVVTWNPLLSDIVSKPDSEILFDSSMIPGEIIDLLVINTQTLIDNPNLGKALVGAWYEVMSLMYTGDDVGSVRSYIAEAVGSDLERYNAQLATTDMFYEPDQALELANSAELVSTMQQVAEFSFEQGMLGYHAEDSSVYGVEIPAGTIGDNDNIKLRFNTEYMQMAADGKL